MSDPSDMDSDLPANPPATGPPVGVDDDWRKAELEKMMFGDEDKSFSGKIIMGIAFLSVGSILGWVAFGPSAPEPTRVAIPTTSAADVAPPVPRKPPPPPPPPKPYKDLFEIQTQFDGTQYIVYTIQTGDTLARIGEILHDVTGVSRLITYQAVSDAYWTKYFSYEDQNADVVTDEMVQERVGEYLQIPVPLPEYPDYDLAVKIEEYNAS
ncbi:MAG: hypothetical protein O7A07_07160 [Acidobacteria bacterium]|nr:hypothetical protein [Acidobacteriota bacterium]